MTTHELLFVPGNDVFRESGVQSTARKGLKWANAAKPGDILVLTLEDDDPRTVLGYAVVVFSEAMTFGDIIMNADRNHCIPSDFQSSMTQSAGDVLTEALTRAYGENQSEDAYTELGFVRIPQHVGPRATIYDEIENERAYQDRRWGTEIDDTKNTPWMWVAYITAYATKWMIGTFPPVDAAVVDDFKRKMTKTATLGVAAIESVNRQRAKNGRCFFEME